MGGQKGRQNHDFLRWYEIAFRIVKTMVCGTLGVPEATKNQSYKNVKMLMKLMRSKTCFGHDFLSLEGPKRGGRAGEKLTKNPLVEYQIDQKPLVFSNRIDMAILWYRSHFRMTIIEICQKPYFF